MTIERISAQMTVSDLERSERWYASVFGRAPDARPMDGLLEWHPLANGGIQVAVDAARAGCSTTVLGVSSLAEDIERIDAAGIAHEPPIDATAVRLVQLTDLDGNCLILTEDLPDAAGGSDHG